MDDQSDKETKVVDGDDEKNSRVRRRADGKLLPGSVLNPKGQPRGKRVMTLETVIKNKLSRLDPRTNATPREAIATQLIERAMAGEEWALKLIVDREWIVPRQTNHEVNVNTGVKLVVSRQVADLVEGILPEEPIEIEAEVIEPEEGEEDDV